MSWRIIQITKNSKIELKLNYLIVRQMERIQKVFIPEIAIIIVESTQVSLTAALLNEVVKNKIKVIFCDEKRFPYGELVPYYGSHDSANKLRQQIIWNKETSNEIWKKIVVQKISKQRDLLIRNEFDESAELLDKYSKEVEVGDATNREGHAAKVYFNTLFGKDFSRKQDNPINASLNFGYQILLSAISREISISGYSTQLGIFHDNMFNQYNLASDLIEPFRPLVDEIVVSLMPDKFESEEKRKILEIFETTIYIDGKEQFLLNAIKIFVNSFFDAIEKQKPSELKEYEVEIHESDSIL